MGLCVAICNFVRIHLNWLCFVIDLGAGFIKITVEIIVRLYAEYLHGHMYVITENSFRRKKIRTRDATCWINTVVRTKPASPSIYRMLRRFKLNYTVSIPVASFFFLCVPLFRLEGKCARLRITFPLTGCVWSDTISYSSIAWLRSPSFPSNIIHTFHSLKRSIFHILSRIYIFFVGLCAQQWII